MQGHTGDGGEKQGARRARIEEDVLSDNRRCRQEGQRAGKRDGEEHTSGAAQPSPPGVQAERNDGKVLRRPTRS